MLFSAAGRCYGGNDFAAGGLDWCSANSFCHFPGTSRSMSTIAAGSRRSVASSRARIFVFFIDANDGAATGFDFLRQ